MVGRDRHTPFFACRRCSGTPHGKSLCCGTPTSRCGTPRQPCHSMGSYVSSSVRDTCSHFVVFLCLTQQSFSGVVWGEESGEGGGRLRTDIPPLRITCSVQGRTPWSTCLSCLPTRSWPETAFAAASGAHSFDIRGWACVCVCVCTCRCACGRALDKHTYPHLEKKQKLSSLRTRVARALSCRRATEALQARKRLAGAELQAGRRTAGGDGSSQPPG